MYASILWATDGSPHSDAALEEAIALLEPGGRIVAFHSDQRFVGSRIGGEPVLLDEPERLERIDEQVDGLLRDGIAVTKLVEPTIHDPAREITAAADELRVDAIVCGTRGLHGVAALMSGSVAARVLKRASVPVIVVPSQAVVRHPDAATV